jgi:hypothetical protein
MSEVSFPHPVLGNGDDVGGIKLDSELTYHASAEAVELQVTGLASGNRSLDDAIRTGRATWLVRVQCARTYFRRVWIERGPTATIRIAGPDLEGTVEVEARACTLESMPWRPEGMHADYAERSFQLNPSEVLALGPTWRFHVDKQFDPLRAPVASWMRIVEGEHEEGPFQVTFEDDFVTIRLSRKDWAQYPGVRDRAPSVLHASVVLPVLMQALRELKEDDGVKWKGRLKAVLDARGLDPESPLVTAQQLLDAPLARCLRELNVKLDGDDS